MAKTLVTKLVNSVNADLLKLGELRISIVPKGNAGQKISLRSNKAQTLSVVDGSDYLSGDSSFSNLISSVDISNNTTQPVYYKIDSTYQVSLSNKYALTRLMFDLGRSCKLDIEQLTYSTLMEYLNLDSSQCEGNISSLSGLTALTSLNAANTSVSGNISSLSGLTALTSLNAANTSVSGNISSLSDLTALTYLSVANTSVSGDISSLSDLTALTYLDLSTSSCKGSLDSLAEGMITSGRISGILKIYANGFTLNNAKVSSICYITFSNGRATIGTSSGGSELASYDGKSWTYNS